MTEAAAPAMREYSDVEYVFAPHDNSLPAAMDYLKAVWARRGFMVAVASVM